MAWVRATPEPGKSARYRSSAPRHWLVLYACFDEVGIDRVRQRSLELTDYLMNLVEDSGMRSEPYSFGIGTPRDHNKRGGHVAIEHEHGAQINAALKQRGVIPDYRPPNCRPARSDPVLHLVRRRMGHRRDSPGDRRNRGVSAAIGSTRRGSLTGLNNPRPSIVERID